MVQAGKDVLWMLLTNPAPLQGQTIESSNHTSNQYFAAFNDGLRASTMLHPEGQVLLLDVDKISQECAPWCTAPDGFYANAAVHGVQMQILANLMGIDA